MKCPSRDISAPLVNETANFLGEEQCLQQRFWRLGLTSHRKLSCRSLNLLCVFIISRFHPSGRTTHNKLKLVKRQPLRDDAKATKCKICRGTGLPLITAPASSGICKMLTRGTCLPSAAQQPVVISCHNSSSSGSESRRQPGNPVPSLLLASSAFW